LAEKVDIEDGSIKQIDGYVADVAYPSKVHFSFQAPWIDAVLALHGVVPPRSDDGIFTHVDLGCGDGVGLILAAASHPNAHFIGVDAMPEHIARGQAIIDQIGLSNITLHCGGFADLMHLADGKADYVIAHGVLAWISDANRECLLALASKWLAPGGAFCISYNCYPGWSEIAPFQALIRAMAMEKTGSSTQRFEAALDDLRASGPIDDHVLAWIDDLRRGLSQDYFAHEYLNAHWRPCWSGNVVGALEALGLAFVGQAGNSQLRDDLCLKAQWRTMLANFPAITAREIARDIVTNAWFRRDVYLKVPGFGFEGQEQNDYRIKQWWALSQAAAETNTFKSATPAGEIDFDNDAARLILEKLKQGPTCLTDLTIEGRLGRADILNTIDALWVGERIMPVNRPIESDLVKRTNSSLRDLGVAINGCATRYGVMPPQGEA
jgi:SAM-dependent methyltransferase